MQRSSYDALSVKTKASIVTDMVNLVIRMPARCSIWLTLESRAIMDDLSASARVDCASFFFFLFWAIPNRDRTLSMDKVQVRLVCLHRQHATRHYRQLVYPSSSGSSMIECAITKAFFNFVWLLRSAQTHIIKRPFGSRSLLRMTESWPK
jgi:hypothetical protein